MNRRTFLGALAALPGLAFLRKEEPCTALDEPIWEEPPETPYIWPDDPAGKRPYSLFEFFNEVGCDPVEGQRRALREALSKCP